MTTDTHPSTTLPFANCEPAACGHRHLIDTYARGCAYGTHLAGAVEATCNGDREGASMHVTVGDTVLCALDRVTDADALRDFIAGIHAGLEAHLRTVSLRGG